MVFDAIKIFLSVACVVVAALFILIASSNISSNSGMFGAAGFFLFLAAAPWIDITKTSRALGLAGIVVSLGFLFFAYVTATGNEIYPKICSGRKVKVLMCELDNLLYFLGGRPAVAIPRFLMAILTCYGSSLAFKNSRNC